MIYFSTVQYTKNCSHNEMIIEIVNGADRIKGIIYPQKSNWFDKNNILLYVYFFLLQTTLIRGVRGFKAFKKNEIINKLNVCKKHPF